jgi:hypothetical protein
MICSVAEALVEALATSTQDIISNKTIPMMQVNKLRGDIFITYLLYNYKLVEIV